MGEEYQRESNITSIVPLSGNVSLHDNFNEGNLWTISATKTGFLGHVQSVYSYSNNFALQIKTVSTGGDANDYIQATRRIFLLPKPIVIIESIFNIETTSYLGVLDVLAQYQYIGHFKYIGLRYSKSTNKWYVQTDASTFTVIDDVARVLYPGVWNKLIFSFNTETNKYISLTVNEHVYDLRSFSFVDAVSSSYSAFTLIFQITTATGAAVDLLLDEISVFGRND